MKEWLAINKAKIAIIILTVLLMTTNVSSLADRVMLDITEEVENRILGHDDRGGK